MADALPQRESAHPKEKQTAANSRGRFNMENAREGA